MGKLVAATYAPMNQHKNVDTGVINDYTQFLRNNGVTGVFINGSTGDFTSLNVEERKTIIEAWANVQTDNFAIMSHVGDTSLRTAKELAAFSSDKATAISALAPFYFTPKHIDDLLFYCKEIAKSAPNLPFYYYHIPVLTGIHIPILEFYEKASSEIENFGGVKFTEDDLTTFSACKSITKNGSDVMFGVDEKFVPSLEVGAESWIGSTYNHLAPLYLQAKEAFVSGDKKRAFELQNIAIYFVETLNSLTGFNGAGKSFLNYLGIQVGPSRYPHQDLSERLLSVALSLFEQRDVLSYISQKENIPIN